MSVTVPIVTDTEAISAVLQTYFDGAKSGRSEDVKPAFHEGATIYGYVGPDLFGGPIQGFYEWHDANGPATELRAEIASIDVCEMIATARVELDDWTGHKFTDMFTFLKSDGQWKIISKVFYMHP